MTTAADDAAVEDAFEAILAGRAAPGGAAGLAAFTEAVRATATQPGRPSAALADLLVSGRLADQSSPSTRAARSAGSPPSRGSRVRIRRRFAMIFPALLAKILAGGALAQAATGATVVVVAVTGAGAAGVLPGPVQDRFAAVVEVVTPFEATTSDDEPTEELPVTGEPVEETPLEEPVVDEVDDEGPVEEPTELSVAEWAAGPSPDGTFGAWVSAASGNEALKAELRELGLTFGDVVSCHARARNDEGDRSTAECAALVVPPTPVGTDGTSPDGDAVEQTAEADATVQSGTTTQERGGRGNGSGGGNGGGNGGNGNAGGNGGGNGNAGGNGGGNGNAGGNGGGGNGGGRG